MSIPVPKDFRTTRDFFTWMMLNAPDFEFMNRHVDYKITVEMAGNALIEGVNALSDRTKKPEEKALFSTCVGQVRESLALYKEQDVLGAKRRLVEAENTFASASKAARGAKVSDLWEDKD